MTTNSQGKQSVKDVEQLFSSAQVSQKAEDILVANLNDSAAALAACQGVDALNLGATEATIVVEILDGSGSMQDVVSEVRESMKESVAAMTESKQSVAMTLSLITFDDDDRVVFSNKPVDTIKDSDIKYSSGGSTALFDAILDGITGALAYEEQLLRAGMSTKVILVVYTDGAENASTRATAAKIKSVAKDVLKRENWTLALVGFKTYEQVDYKDVSDKMGFSDLLEIDLSGDTYQRRHAIRQTFRLTSKSVIRKSQTAVNPNAPANSFFVNP